MVLAREPNLLLVHPHSSRTGGKTMRSALVQACGEGKVYGRTLVEGAKPWRSITDADVAGYRAYSDMHSFTGAHLLRPCLGIGVLRDPVQRAISLYNFARRNEHHSLRELALSTDLETFYNAASRREPNYFRNLQCRRICGHADAVAAVDAIHSRYIGVGFTEDVDAFIEALRGVFGWPAVEHRPKTPRSASATGMTESFRTAVLRDNEEDAELFRVMSSGPPYRVSPRSVGRKLRAVAKRGGNFALSAARKVLKQT